MKDKVWILLACTNGYPMAKEYVNNLARGFSKYLGRDSHIAVISDGTTLPIGEFQSFNLGNECHVIVLPQARKVWGWWNLMQMYEPNAPWSNSHLIMVGLDTVIKGNLSWIFERTEPTYLKPFSDEHGRVSPFNGTYADGLVYLPPHEHYTKVWERYLEEVTEEETYQRKRGFPMHPWVTNIIKQYYAEQPEFWQDVRAGSVVSYREPVRKIEEPPHPMVIFHGNPRPHEARDEAQWINKYWREE